MYFIQVPKASVSKCPYIIHGAINYTNNGVHTCRVALDKLVATTCKGELKKNKNNFLQAHD